METGVPFRISAFAVKSITFCITAAMSIVTGYIDGSCGAFAVLIVGTVVCFAVDVNGLTPIAGICGIFYRTFFLSTEAFTGGIICITCICSFNIDGSPGTERIFVIVAVVCGTFKICHKSVLLIIMILPETVSLPECAPCLIVSTAIKPDRFRCCIVCPKEEKIILKKIHNNIKKQLTNSRHHGILLKYVAKRKQSSLSPQR